VRLIFREIDLFEVVSVAKCSVAALIANAVESGRATGTLFARNAHSGFAVALFTENAKVDAGSACCVNQKKIILLLLFFFFFSWTLVSVG
jgi:hypothetical protein